MRAQSLGRVGAGPVEFSGRVVQRLQRGGPHHGLHYHGLRHHVQRRAALADVGVDAHRVAFAEGLPQKPHGVQRQRGRVEGVYARVGRSGRVGGLAVKDDRFAGEAVAGHVAQKEVAFAGNHMYMRGQRKVHAVEAARAQQFGFAAGQNSTPCFCSACRVPMGTYSSAGTAKNATLPESASATPGALSASAAPTSAVSCASCPQAWATPFSGFAAGCAGQRMPSSSPMTAAQGAGRAALQNGLYACAGQTGLRRKPAAAQQFGHTGGGACFKKARLGVRADILCKGKQRFTLGVNGGKDLLFNGIHGFEPPQYGNKGRQKTAPIFPGVWFLFRRTGRDIQTRFIGRRPCGNSVQTLVVQASSGFGGNSPDRFHRRLR